MITFTHDFAYTTLGNQQIPIACVYTHLHAKCKLYAAGQTFMHARNCCIQLCTQCYEEMLLQSNAIDRNKMVQANHAILMKNLNITPHVASTPFIALYTYYKSDARSLLFPTSPLSYKKKAAISTYVCTFAIIKYILATIREGFYSLKADLLQHISKSSPQI